MRRFFSLAIAMIFAALLAPVTGGQPAWAASPTVSAFNTIGPLPSCKIADSTTRFNDYGDWSRTLVDWNLRVSSKYAPKDLVPVSRAEITGSGSIRSFVIPDLKAMTRAARTAGASIGIQSAYRSYATQASSFRGWVNKLGYAQAIMGSARAGHSEHQLGVAIDFNTKGGAAPWSFNGYDWAKSKPGAWMSKNAWKYGFVMSYPKGKIGSVCYGYEPWHYRYFGQAVAKAIHDSGQTPRVWLWQHGAGG